MRCRAGGSVRLTRHMLRGERDDLLALSFREVQNRLVQSAVELARADAQEQILGKSCLIHRSQ